MWFKVFFKGILVYMKSFLEIMAQRQSFPKLCDPAPDKKTMNKIFNASLRAPDHMQLRPWRFLNIEVLLEKN